MIKYLSAAEQAAQMSAREKAIARELGRTDEDFWFTIQGVTDVTGAATVLQWTATHDYSVFPPRLIKSARDRLSEALLAHSPPIPSMPEWKWKKLGYPSTIMVTGLRGRPLWVMLGPLLAVAPDLIRNGAGPRQPLPT